MIYSGSVGLHSLSHFPSSLSISQKGSKVFGQERRSKARSTLVGAQDGSETAPFARRLRGKPFLLPVNFAFNSSIRPHPLGVGSASEWRGPQGLLYV
ncbi:hypothetical protein EVAR_76510_1 [Eumeta japonica]|uniref:Uncharacterized protein n=1 Tax=Eumeta variegata TaxID=151549 RepID=A0A4C1T7N7_EUMVA|nr:hypothetical protein EVAR_76510_1 [Eumeta japonica]